MSESIPLTDGIVRQPRAASQTDGVSAVPNVAVTDTEHLYQRALALEPAAIAELVALHRELTERAFLSPEEVEEGLRFTQAQLDTLNAISEGRELNGRVPGIREVTQALQLKATFTVGKPGKAPPEKTPQVIQVIDPYADAGATFDMVVTRQPNQD